MLIPTKAVENVQKSYILYRCRIYV